MCPFSANRTESLTLAHRLIRTFLLLAGRSDDQVETFFLWSSNESLLFNFDVFQKHCPITFWFTTCEHIFTAANLCRTQNAFKELNYLGVNFKCPNGPHYAIAMPIRRLASFDSFFRLGSLNCGKLYAFNFFFKLSSLENATIGTIFRLK